MKRTLILLALAVITFPFAKECGKRSALARYHRLQAIRVTSPEMNIKVPEMEARSDVIKRAREKVTQHYQDKEGAGK